MDIDDPANAVPDHFRRWRLRHDHGIEAVGRDEVQRQGAAARIGGRHPNAVEQIGIIIGIEAADGDIFQLAGRGLPLAHVVIADQPGQMRDDVGDIAARPLRDFLGRHDADDRGGAALFVDCAGLAAQAVAGDNDGIVERPRIPVIGRSGRGGCSRIPCRGSGAIADRLGGRRRRQQCDKSRRNQILCGTQHNRALFFMKASPFGNRLSRSATYGRSMTDVFDRFASYFVTKMWHFI